MTGLEKLLAIEAIKAVEACRVRSLDMQDWETYAEVHVPEMEHNYGPGPSAIGIEAVVAKVRARMNGAVSEHHVSVPEIELLSEDEAIGTWKMQDEVIWRGSPQRRLRGSGYYRCRYVRREGRWLIAARTLERLRLEEETITFPSADQRAR